MNELTRWDEYERLYHSPWYTRELARWALTWNTYPENRYASTKPIWKHIAGSEADAIAFYASQTDEDRRVLAADALVSAGWTLDRINFRKS